MNEFGTEFAVSAGAGLVLLGFGLVLVDFFVARLLRQTHPPELDVSEQDLLVSALSDKEKRRIQTVQSRYHAGVTHRMRRGALVVIGTGLLVLVVTGITRLM